MRLFRRIKLKYRISMSFMIVLLVFILSGISNMVQMKSMEENSIDIKDNYVSLINVTNKLENETLELIFLSNKYFASGLEDDYQLVENQVILAEDALNLTKSHVELYKSSVNLYEPIESEFYIIKDLISEAKIKYDKANTHLASSMDLGHKWIAFTNDFVEDQLHLADTDNVSVYQSKLFEVITLNQMVNNLNLSNYQAAFEQDARLIESNLSYFQTIKDALILLDEEVVTVREKQNIVKMNSYVDVLQGSLTSMSGSWQQLREVQDKLDNEFVRLKNSIHILSLSGINATEESMKTQIELASKVVSNNNIYLIISIILSVITAFALTFSLTKRINNMLRFSNEIANGQLSDEFLEDKSEDELSDLTKSINTMKDNIRSLIIRIADSSESLNIASKELNNNAIETTESTETVLRTVGHISERAENQALESQRALNIISELDHTLDQSSSKVRSLNDLSLSIKTLIADGESIINDLKGNTNESSLAMNRIIKSVDMTASHVDTISGASSLINKIAEQTNLLALNAAIEAARAGQYGYGFSVVAEEIRKLAVESSKITKEIDMMIDALAEQAENAKNMGLQVIDATKQQENSVQDTSRIYFEISDRINDSLLDIDEINLLSVDMSRQKESVINVVDKLSDIASKNVESTKVSFETTEEISINAENIEEKSEQLSLLSDQLKDHISQLNIIKEINYEQN